MMWKWLAKLFGKKEEQVPEVPVVEPEPVKVRKKPGPKPGSKRKPKAE